MRPMSVGYTFALLGGGYHLIPLDPQVYAVPYVPFHPSFFDGLWIRTVALGISIGATILPARVAVRLLPGETHGYDCGAPARGTTLLCSGIGRTVRSAKGR